MTSDRAYRARLSDEQALGLLRAGAGSHWDAGIVDAFPHRLETGELAAALAHTALEDRQRHARALGRRHILNAELFEAALEQAGHTIVVERDGVSGRDRALAEPFDVVVLDVQMPRMSGIDVVRSLRAGGLRIPVLALSAAALPDQIAAGLAAGFDDYLAKPVSPKLLREKVDALVR